MAFQTPAQGSLCRRVSWGPHFCDLSARGAGQDGPVDPSPFGHPLSRFWPRVFGFEDHLTVLLAQSLLPLLSVPRHQNLWLLLGCPLSPNVLLPSEKKMDPIFVRFPYL